MSIPYYPVSALAQLLSHRVPLVDDEVLIEDLEDLPTLEICHGGVGWWVRGLEWARWKNRSAGEG